MISPEDVSACLVTRGGVDMEEILATLPYGEIVVWDNSRRPDLKVAGRYGAALMAETDLVYFQDDDVIFRDHDALLAAAGEGKFVVNDAHGSNPGGYEDVGLVGAGSIIDRRVAWDAIDRYLAEWPLDEDFLYEVDFVVGSLVQFETLKLPYARLYSDDATRLCSQPWQEGLKRELTDRARSLR